MIQGSFAGVAKTLNLEELEDARFGRLLRSEACDSAGFTERHRQPAAVEQEVACGFGSISANQSSRSPLTRSRNGQLCTGAEETRSPEESPNEE
jgi:hypothetical protein